MPKTALDSFGYIRINKHCQVEGFPAGNVFACGDSAFAAAHVMADRSLISVQVHSFVTRLNILELAQQAASGVAPERRAPTHAVPWSFDPDHQETGFANEGFSGAMLGHGRGCFVMAPGVNSKKGWAKELALDKMKESSVKILEKGGETANAAVHVLWCDTLRNPDMPSRDMHFMVRPGFTEKSNYQALWGGLKFIATHPGLGFFVFKNVMTSKAAAKACHAEGDEAMQVPTVDLEAFRPERLFEELDAAPAAAQQEALFEDE